MANIPAKTKQQDNDIVAKKHQITNNKKKQQVMDKGKKQGKNQSIVIVNSKAKTTRPITLKVPVQEQKLKLKRGGKKTI